MSRRKNAFSIYRLECPVCGEGCYMSELEFEDMLLNEEEFECEECGYTDEIDNWPSDDYTKATITILDDGILVEEE